ncbi:MAG: histidine kinase [Christiangramia sp.]
MKANRNTFIFILTGLTLLCIPIVTSPDFSKGIHMFDVPPFQRSFLGYILLLLYFFLNYFLFIPKFYSQKKYVIFGLVTLACFLLVTFLPEVLISVQAPQPPQVFREPGMNMREPGFHPGPQPGLIFQFGLVFILSLLLRIQHQVSELKNEKISAELSYLKAKINPHFLFNTLNSLYALALTQNKQTPNAILKLSSLMRYVVSESESKKVSLKKELTYIEDYIELQKLRFSENVEFHYEVSGEPNGYEIAPLILINYIENAFKFGLHTDKRSIIEILIHVENSRLQLKTCNRIVYKNGDVPGTEEGLQNSTNRLNLIYSGNYSLESGEKDGFYLVNLNIKLDD